MPKPIKYTLLTIILLLLVIAGGFLGLQQYQVKQAMKDWSNEEIQAFDKWTMTPIDVTMDEVRAAEFSDETITARDVVYTEWRRLGPQLVNLKNDIDVLTDIKTLAQSTETRERAGRLSLAADSLLQALANLVSQDDYLFEVFSVGRVSRLAGQKNTINMVQDIARLLWMRAGVEVANGEYNKAILTASLLHQTMKMHPYRSSVSQLINLSIIDNELRVFQEIVSNTDNEETLRKVGSALDEIEASWSPSESIEELITTDQLSVLHQISQDGYEMKIEGLRPQQLVEGLMKLQAQYYNEVELPTQGGGQEQAVPGVLTKGTFVTLVSIGRSSFETILSREAKIQDNLNSLRQEIDSKLDTIRNEDQ